MRSAKAARRNENNEESQDSFLDVVANVVGVLIVLVMVVGLQASQKIFSKPDKPSDELEQQAVQPPQDNVAELNEKLAQETREALKMQQNIQGMVQRAVSIHQEANAHDQRRIELAMHRSVLEQDIEHRREKLDAQSKRKFDVQRQIVEHRLKLNQLTEEQLTLIEATETVEVECLPTPLAKRVDGQAIHLRLSHGLVSIVPFQQLLDERDYRIEGMRQRFSGRDAVDETFGPIDGYRMKFIVLRHRQSGAVNGPLVGQVQQTSLDFVAEFMPLSNKMGQNVEQALMPGATLHSHLQTHRRDRIPVVVWFYPDSFDELRMIKRALWEMGYAHEVRPMKPNTNIMASNRGTKSYVQ